ncbi:hypothetical protein GCM10010384_60350 [Streptomyces djakartensis]|uniref:Uncharacterized protein n=1 Tax=Streptomyces djakartensis TaxID=68193 RepID=A0ABQ3AC56_9ACTN|nr:hypothetical protein GCM10010384_60350 [Streptomyces djakartensis]
MGMRNESKQILRILAYFLVGCATVMAVSVIVMLAMGARPAVIHVAPLVAAGCGLLLLRHTKGNS